jgi:DNA-binding PadR family transcriptional regulator
VLEFALLGLLKERPMHGYDLRKRLREEFGPLSNLSYGSLYPALARLEADGMISALDASGSTQRRDPMPLTGSLGGERAATVARRATQVAALALTSRGTRGRKVYEITSRGEVLFEQLLEAEVATDDPRDFSLRLAFARHLSPSARIRLLERRRLAILGRLDRAGRAVRQPPRTLDRYELAIAEHAEAVVANELAWVEALLRSEEEFQELDAAPEFARDSSQGVSKESHQDPNQLHRAVAAQVETMSPSNIAPASAGAGSQEERSH